MKDRIILLAISIFTFSNLHSQDYQQYEREVANIASQIYDKINNEDVCDELIRQLDETESDINRIFERNESLYAEDVISLKKAEKQSDALAAFLRTVSASSNGGYLSRKQLKTVNELLDFSMSEIYPGKFCINLYEIKVGLFKAILAMQKEGDRDMNLVAYITSKGGLKSTKMDMGLAFHEYRKIWSNEDDLDNSRYEVTRVECNFFNKF